MRSEDRGIRVMGIPGLRSETWGTRDLWVGRNEEQPQVLRLAALAQDDSFLWKACR